MSFWRRRREQDLNDEIQAHLAMNIRDRMERGEDPQAAELAARREFGNRTLVAETTRYMWSGNWLAGLWQDARYGLRGMRRSPGFTAVAVVSLALGIGANTAIFSLLETVMFRTLPVSHPEQLVELLQKYPGEPRGNWWSWRSYEHFRDHNHVFSDLTGTLINNRTRLVAEGAEPVLGVGEHVNGNYFSTLGVKPALGRLIGPEDAAGAAVAVVSWSWWTNRLHQDPSIPGKRMFVDDAPVTIIGVAPRPFVGIRADAKTDVWLPPKSKLKTGEALALLGRLRPGATINQARAEMAVLHRFTLEERFADSKDPQVRQISVEVEAAGAGLATVRDRFSKPLFVLMAAVGLLLSLACVNIASMLLARGAGRAREIALRASLGASRGRLLRQVLTESVMLSGLGALVGVAVAYFGAATLLRIMASGREPVDLEVRPDLHVLLFVTGIAVLAGLLFGLAPALSAFWSAPVFALRQAGRGGETRAWRLFGKTLVAAQVALSVLLLSSASLFIAHLLDLEHADLGFRRDHVLLVTLDPSHSGYSGDRLSSAYREILDRLQRIPSVRSASLSAPTPLSGAGASGFARVDGFQERPEDRRWNSISWIAPRYFETLGPSLLSGREFTYDDQAHPRVAIINQTLARYYFSGTNPIGKHITLFHVTLDPEPKTYEIVGVAADANYYEIRETTRRYLYLPAFAANGVHGAFVIRSNIAPEAVASDVRSIVRDVVPNIPVTRITTLTSQIDATIVPERMIATLCGFFGVLGALLAGIGIYGLLAFTVARRTNEIGVRLALGADSGNITRMVLRDAFTIVIAGLLLGAPVAIWTQSLTRSFIADLRLQAGAPAAIGAMTIIAVALLAAFVPARHAARVDPMAALRHE